MLFYSSMHLHIYDIKMKLFNNPESKKKSKTYTIHLYSNGTWCEMTIILTMAAYFAYRKYNTTSNS